MMYRFIFTVLILSLSACNILKPHEKAAQVQASDKGLTAVVKPHFDATFVLSSVNFSQYKKIKLNELDLSKVKIITPSSTPLQSFPEPWQLNDEDRRYYQEKYAEAAKKSLIDSGLYVATNDVAADTLLLKTKLIQIAPHAAKDDLKSRPNFTKVYSEGFGRMTVVFEVYDSVTNKLVASAADDHDLGTMWEENNRLQNNMRIRLAFDYWLNNLKRELEKAAQQPSITK